MSEQSTEISIPEQFKDIAPYGESEFHDKLKALVKEPGFEFAMRYVMPGLQYDDFVNDLLASPSQEAFQRQKVGAFLEMLAKRTSSGISMDGVENCKPGTNYTFITNHRDIVLDASFLNMCFIRAKLPITQIAIGNNLLIYDWIADLVKLNRSFIVKRNVKMIEALEAAKQLSAYIHFTILQKHESVWIAQREGRAKDSNDLTQESLIKMLSLSGDGNTKENLLEINLCPVSISYEFDPNDYLKAREFLLKRRNPDFKKSQRDDLFSMETGMLSFKGRIHFRIGKCINEKLSAFDSDNRTDIIRKACSLIDNTIHSGYEIFPCNYIAYDLSNHTNEFANQYNEKDIEKFDEYVNSQLNKVDVPDITEEEREYMRNMILSMYANPLKNKISAQK